MSDISIIFDKIFNNFNYHKIKFIIHFGVMMMLLYILGENIRNIYDDDSINDKFKKISENRSNWTLIGGILIRMLSVFGTYKKL